MSRDLVTQFSYNTSTVTDLQTKFRVKSNLKDNQNIKCNISSTFKITLITPNSNQTQKITSHAPIKYFKSIMLITFMNTFGILILLTFDKSVINLIKT